MNDTVIKNKKTINAVLTLIGIIFFIFSVSLSVYDYILEQDAIAINATITALDYSGSSSYATISYKVENIKYEQKIKVFDKDLTVKDTIEIKYNIKNPNNLINNNHMLIILITFCISLILILTNISKFMQNLNESNRLKKLYKTGIYIEANIIEIFTNNNGRKIKGKLPYKLRCKYLNPNNNQEYLFESNDTYMNLNDIVSSYNRKTVFVLLDKTNSNNYYVDLGSLIPQIKLIDPKEFMKNSGNKEVQQ